MLHLCFMTITSETCSVLIPFLLSITSHFLGLISPFGFLSLFSAAVLDDAPSGDAYGGEGHPGGHHRDRLHDAQWRPAVLHLPYPGGLARWLIGSSVD